jgi:hypothetical protein
MGRSVLRPYMFSMGFAGSCLVLEAGGGKIAAKIFHMMI